MACYLMQAAGVLLSVWLPSLAGFAFGSLLLGLPFTAITLFALQEARRAAARHVGADRAAHRRLRPRPDRRAAAGGRRPRRASASPGAGFCAALQSAAAALWLAGAR